MRIGINALWLLPGMIGGAETYLRGLLSGLSRREDGNDYVLYTNTDNHETFAQLGPRFQRKLFASSARWDLLSLTMIRVVGEQFFLPWHSSRDRLDVLHCPLDIAPLAAGCPVVLTIHDLNFDAVHETSAASARKIGQSLVRASARRADVVLTVSQFSRGEICRDLAVPSRKIRVVYNAPAPRPQAPPQEWPRLRARLGLREPYLLAFSSFNAHKNIGSLIEAFALLTPRARPQLVVCGHLPRLGPALPRLAQRLGVGERVIFTGYLADEELHLVLENARALAFPSLYEGFGLPVVEAMASGVPVACSRTASLPEVAGDAALFFNPRDTQEISGCLKRLLSDEELRAGLIAAGRRNARRFSWDASAAKTTQAYELAARGLTLGPGALEASAP